MRNMISILSVALLVSGCGDGKKAERQMRESYPVLEEIAPPLPEGFPLAATVMVEFVEVGFEDFTQWSVDHPMGPGAANLLRREVQNWIANDRARISETMAVYCATGKRAKTSSVREFLYPSEHSYESVVSSSDGNKNDEPETDKAKKKGGKTKKKKEPSVKSNPSPVGFEVRKAGVSLEVSVVSIDAKSGVIELEINPQLVQHLGTMEWKAAAGNDLGDFVSPVFDVRKINAGLTLQDGAYSLLGIGKPQQELQAGARDESILIAFIRADSNRARTP